MDFENQAEPHGAGGGSLRYRAVPLIGIRKGFDVNFAQKKNRRKSV